MKVLVTDVKAQLGHDVVKYLKNRSIEYTGVDIDDFDITNHNHIRNYINKYKPTVVIHCSAYTVVDRAEDDKELCYKVNAGRFKRFPIWKDILKKYI